MIEFALRTPPISPNNLLRWHWQKRRRYKRLIETELMLVIATTSGYESPFERRARLETQIFNKTRRLDPDNATASLKLHIDALRKYGLIFNDSEKWLDLAKPQQFIDKKDPRVIFRITLL